METIYVRNLIEARKKIKEYGMPQLAILFRNYSERAIGAWIYNGGSSGNLVTRYDIKKYPNLSFNHNYNGNQKAFNILQRELILKRKKG